jgi:hypothetical protein
MQKREVEKMRESCIVLTSARAWADDELPVLRLSLVGLQMLCIYNNIFLGAVNYSAGRAKVHLRMQKAA